MTDERDARIKRYASTVLRSLDEAALDEFFSFDVVRKAFLSEAISVGLTRSSFQEIVDRMSSELSNDLEDE